jgi:hypothetical protein
LGYVQIITQFAPVLLRGKFNGKYLIKVIVKQGNPAQLYCFSKKVKLVANNDPITEE